MNFEEISSMISLGFNGFALLTLLVAFLLGLKRGVFKSAVRTVSLLLSALVSLLIVNLALPSIVSSVAGSLLDSMGGGDAMGDILKAETTLRVMEALICAMIAPVIFIFVYFIVNKLFLIVCAIVNRIFKQKYKALEEKIPCRRLFGGLISMVGALVTLAVIATPIGGYTELVEHVAEAADEVVGEEANDSGSSSNDLMEGVEVIGSFGDAVAIKVPYAMGGNLFFKSLTTLRIEKGGVIDKNINATLEHEIIGIFDLIPLAENIGDVSFSDINHLNVQPLHDVADALADDDSSDIVRIMVADIFSTASTRWLNGESYLSINLMDLVDGDAEALRAAIKPILTKLSNTHVSTVGDDLNDLLYLFEDIKDAALSFTNITNKLNEGGVITADDVVAVIEKLTPEAAEVINASLPSVIGQTGVGGRTAQSITNVLSGALTGMAELNVSDASEEEIKKEAEAVRTVMTLAMNPDEDMTEDEADDLIDTIMDSSVLAGSIQTTVAELENNGETSDMNLSDADKDKVKDKLDSYAEENVMDEDKLATLNALHSFFGTDSIGE